MRGYAVALEICDLQQLPDDAQAIVAENVLHRAVAFGPWRAKLPTRMTASLLVNGEIQDAAQAESDLAARLCAAARVLGAIGERLRAGDRIITSLVVQVPIHPGDGVIGNMGELGRVGLRIRPMAETALDREGN